MDRFVVFLFSTLLIWGGVSYGPSLLSMLGVDVELPAWVYIASIPAPTLVTVAIANIFDL